nr:integrase, catalytic region, zinc finger, CCHC-type, peptidase aspartic, catalytic [Tanacetum cinerariifolium]
MAGLWFRMFRGDRIGFKETILGVMLLQEMGELKIELERMLLMQAQENKVDLDEEQFLFLAGGYTNTFDDDVDEGAVQDMAQNEDNIFQADQCDAFDSDVDEASTAETMFMANLSSTAPVYIKAGPSYDSDTLSKVQNQDNYLDDMNESHEEHKIQNDVQPNDVVDSDTEYTSNAIGYKNPFYLSKAKQVQPALYSGQEIVKPNHACVLVHDSINTLEIAKTTRKQMNEKMKDPDSLIKEIKEMKEVFDQMEAKVDQYVVDKKCDEIERKNLLLENENLIAECLSKDVFYTATNYVLTVSRFTDMHDAYTVAQKRIAEIEAENYTTSSDAPSFNLVFVIGQLEERLQGRGNTIRELKEKISRLTKKINKAHPILNFKALDSQNKDLIVKVNVLQDLNERFRAQNEKVEQHYKELDDSIKLTRAKTIEKTTSLLDEI